MEQKILTPRRLFSVVINDKQYNVFDIDGKEHEGYNDTPKTWWLYHSEDKLPDGIVPPADSENFVPFCVGIQRHVWEIKFTQRNTTKEKWGGTRFNNSTWTEMWCNKRLIYAFGSTGGDRGLHFSMAKVQYMQVMMSEHCYNFFEPEQENGRKICWYGLPATVKVKRDGWEIGIVPDYTAGLTKEEWWKELKHRESKYSKAVDEMDKQDEEMDKDDHEEAMNSDFINWGDAFSDQHIYWFRK
jgi:hypothetical protein